MFFSKLKENLIKTKNALDAKLESIFSSNKNKDEIIEEIEETLILSDVGANTSAKICNNLRIVFKSEKDKSAENIKRVLRNELVKILSKDKEKLNNFENVSENNSLEKKVILIVGVNGVGKTTSIGKLSNMLKKQGNKVLLAAADTFRAGAIEQLDIWAKRSDCEIFLGKEMEDPSSVIFGATKKFSEGAYDILICDTAGRLHNKKNLMDELEKIKKTIDKNISNAQKEVLIVLDATTGQNAISQVKSFFEKTSLDGIILTKLDSTAKGGVVFSIVDELDIPVKYIGLGEGIDDIEVFDAKSFAESII